MSDIKEIESELKDLREAFERIASSPLSPATVLEIKDEEVRVANSQGEQVVKLPAMEAKKGDFKPGDSILIHPSSHQFVRKNPFSNAGTTAVVVDFIDNKAVIDLEGRPKFVPLIGGLKVGDKVILDAFSSYIIEVLPRSKQGYSVPQTNVTWDDIGGNKHAKQAMIEAIENPHKYRELYEFYGTKGARGILLYGPPGCGKTMLGKAAATSIGSIEGFIYCKGPEVLDPYVGVAEATVRSLFARSRAYQAETGRRAVIFIDEAEAILSERGGRYSFMEKTIVPTFLAEMDGVEDSGAIVILATNQNHHLDPAVVRDGRIDRKIEISRPNYDDSIEIAHAHLKKAPVQKPKAIAKQLVDVAWQADFMHRGSMIPLRDYMSGSLLAGVVEKAKANALRRDIACNSRTGIQSEDINEGLALALHEMGATSLELA